MMYMYIHIPTYTQYVVYTCIHIYLLTCKNENPKSKC